jgi:hypothetical protein
VANVSKALAWHCIHGSFFGAHEVDKARYREISEKASVLLALSGNVPSDRVRERVSDHAQGYATPKLNVRAVVCPIV